MAGSLVQLLTSIADAIREKKGTTGKINAQSMAFEIKTIEPLLGTIELKDPGKYDVKEYKYAQVLPSDVVTDFIGVLQGTASEVRIPEGTTQLRNYAIYPDTLISKITVHIPTTVNRIVNGAFSSSYTATQWDIKVTMSFSDYAQKNYRIIPSNNQGYHLYTNDELITEITDISNLPAQRYVDSNTGGSLGQLIVDRVFIPNGSSVPKGVLAKIKAQEIIFAGTINGELGDGALYGTTANKIILPTNITILGHICLGGLKIAELTIPEGVMEIASMAFSGSSIEKLILPSTLTKIGETSGVVTYPLRDKAIIVVNAVTPPTASSGNIFDAYMPKAIYIPAGTLTAYQNATNWSKYKDVFVEMNEVALNVQAELLNNETYQYSLDGGVTWSVFASSNINFEQIALISFKNTSETTKLLIGKSAGATDIGSITDAELTYATEGSMTIFLRLEEITA